MKILVTGGAGYIGSHMVKCLTKFGHEVIVVDNLSTGFRDAVSGSKLVKIDLLDLTEVNHVFSEYEFEAVIHFAGSSIVSESMSDPEKYYRNNVIASINLFDAMLKNNVNKLIFSSSAAIFGMPEYSPIDENHPKSPINPYGTSKWMIERILADYDKAYGLRSVSLSYFNAAGADPEGNLGERHEPETHLIPLAIRTALGVIPKLVLFGTDYPTPDGTCIRDYVHVLDLCDAHLKALEHLLNGGESMAYNLGNGSGFSVYEVISSVEKETGRRINIEYGDRRKGDPSILVADSSKITEDWNWEPKYLSLGEIVSHALNWEQGNSGKSH